MRTRVVERAASAAALMLSLGDERIAEPGASLLYHLFRLPSNAPVTPASAAALMFADLTRLDEQCLARLVDRAMADADGAAMVSVDVEPSDSQLLRLLTADLPSGAKGRTRTLRGLARELGAPPCAERCAPTIGRCSQASIARSAAASCRSRPASPASCGSSKPRGHAYKVPWADAFGAPLLPLEAFLHAHGP